MATSAVDEDQRLPTVVEAAAMLGIGRTVAYQLVRKGEWPTPIVRAGHLIKIPNGPLRELIKHGEGMSD